VTGAAVTAYLAEEGRASRARVSGTIRIRTSHVTFHVADDVPDHGLAGTAREAAAIARAVIGDDITECVIALYVDTRHHVIGYSEIARGTLNTAHCAPRDVLSRALVLNARGVIVAHNHPSGELSPSRSDRDLTNRLRAGAALLGIAFIDHLIVQGTAVLSMATTDRTW
jgi:DNA repair protein RadC